MNKNFMYLPTPVDREAWVKLGVHTFRDALYIVHNMSSLSSDSKYFQIQNILFKDYIAHAFT